MLRFRQYRVKDHFTRSLGVNFAVPLYEGLTDRF